MKVGFIGRSDFLYNTIEEFQEKNINIVFIHTTRAESDYQRKEEDFERLAKVIRCESSCGGTLIEKINWFQSLNVDIVVSVNYISLINSKVIDCFKYGIINAHGGDLPRYKGNACQAWAIINGEEKIGLTVHRMIGGAVDCGETLAKDYLYINENTRIKQVYEWMESSIPKLFGKVVDALAINKRFVPLEESDTTQGLRCYPRRREDGSIEWKKDSMEIVRLINASSEPYSGAFTKINGEELIIWRAKRISVEEKYCAVSGQVLKILEEGVVVACGTGQICISEVTTKG